MSPGMCWIVIDADGFPRVSGDEPWEGSGSRWNPKFSPREWG